MAAVSLSTKPPAFSPGTLKALVRSAYADASARPALVDFMQETGLAGWMGSVTVQARGVPGATEDIHKAASNLRLISPGSRKATPRQVTWDLHKVCCRLGLLSWDEEPETVAHRVLRERIRSFGVPPPESIDILSRLPRITAVNPKEAARHARAAFKLLDLPGIQVRIEGEDRVAFDLPATHGNPRLGIPHVLNFLFAVANSARMSRYPTVGSVNWLHWSFWQRLPDRV